MWGLFEPEEEEVRLGWRILHTGELHNSSSSPHIIRVIKWRIGWAEQIM
jgi:hypothetical protein